MPSTTTTTYRETLRVPTSWWLLGALFVLAVWWAFFVATPLWVAYVAGAIALVAVGAVLATYGSIMISADAAGLRAGRATIGWEHLGAADALDAEASRRQLGVDANARAFLLLRSYCRQAVRIEVVDSDDPTPYWLVSTRHADRLADYVRAHTVQN